jgi:hypothetical protein
LFSNLPPWSHLLEFFSFLQAYTQEKPTWTDIWKTLLGPDSILKHSNLGGLAGISAAAESGKKVMTSQKYETRNEVASGDKVALKIDWTAPWPCLFNRFLECKDGKIVSQRNYDCYER